MATFFSPETRGFYLTSVNGNNIPADAIEITPQQHQELIDGQSLGKVISVVDGKVVLVDASGPSKEYLMSRIKEKRLQIENGGVQVKGLWFNSDQSSRLQFMGISMGLYAMPKNLKWKTMSGEYITMNKDLAMSICEAIIELDLDAFSNGEKLKTELSTIADTKDFDINRGWPAIYSK